MSVNEEKITTEFIQHSNGFTIAKSDLTTGKVVVNGIEITSIEDWNKVTHSIVELQQENTRLKEKIEKAIEKIKNIDKYEERLNDDTRVYMIQDVDVDEIERILREN